MDSLINLVHNYIIAIVVGTIAIIMYFAGQFDTIIDELQKEASVEQNASAIIVSLEEKSVYELRASDGTFLGYTSDATPLTSPNCITASEGVACGSYYLQNNSLYTGSDDDNSTI